MHRLRRVLGRHGHERRIRERLAAQRPARGVGHRGRTGVDADYESVGSLSRRLQHEAAVARTKVDCDPLVSPGEASEVARLVLLDLASPHDAKHAFSVRAGSFGSCAPAHRPNDHLTGGPHLDSQGAHGWSAKPTVP